MPTFRAGLEHATNSFRGSRHLWHQILDTGPRVQKTRDNPVTLLSWWAVAAGSNLIHLFQCDLPLWPLTFFHLFLGPTIPRLRDCFDSASMKVKCFYCSRASLSLTSSCSALPSLQKRVPWDPSAPLLDGTSDTSGKQEWIKSPCVYKCIWKRSIAGWSHATNPCWHAGNICPTKKTIVKMSQTEFAWAEVRAD